MSTSGFVDTGDGPNNWNIATGALFMVFGLQGHWKAPIGYYLTKGLSPGLQKILLKLALEEQHQHGLEAICITMDGHASNVHMCSLLGGQLEALPYEPLKIFLIIR